MLTKLFQARNFLYSFLYPMRRKYAERISKILALCVREFVKSTLVLPKSEIKLTQTPAICFSLRGINLTTWDMKKEIKCGKTKQTTKGKEIKEAKKVSENEENEIKTSASKKNRKLATEDDLTKEPLVNENPCKGKGNLVAVLYKSHNLILEEREKPKPCPGEVLIAMNCVGLSSTDLSYYTKGELLSPLVLGCEGTGIVAVLGQGVRNLREGDRVVIQPNVPCSQCEFCKNCQSHLCLRPKLCGYLPHDGLLTCYYTHAADYCHKLPERISMEEGVLMNMLANGINACSRCPMCIGATVLIIGAGPIGLISLIAAKAMGATNTCVMCKFKNRLKLAQQYNTKTVQICDTLTPEDLAQSVREELGCAPLITVDSVGSEASIKLAIASTSSGGSIVLTNITDEEHKIPLLDAAHRDITIRSALRHSNKFPAAIALANTGSIDLKALISHHFFFEKVTNAFDTLIEDEEDVNKIIIHIRPRDRNNKIPF